MVMVVAGQRLVTSTGEPDTPWLVSGRLLLGLLPTALEIGFLFAVPLGVALGLKWARADVGPMELGSHLRAALPLAFSWFVLALLLVSYGHRELSGATALLRGLLSEARSACEFTEQRRARVPLLSADWRCEEGQPVRLLGRLRGRGLDGSYALEAIEFDEQPPTLLARELSVKLAPHTSRPGLTLMTRTAKVVGVLGLPPPSRLAPWPRGGLVAISTVAVVLLGFVLAHRRRVVALLLGLTPSLVALGSLFLLDRTPSAPLPLYFGVPLPALLVTLFELRRWRRVPVG